VPDVNLKQAHNLGNLTNTANKHFVKVMLAAGGAAFEGIQVSTLILRLKEDYCHLVANHNIIKA